MHKQSLNVVMVLALALGLIASVGSAQVRAQSSGPPIENSQATPSAGNASGSPAIQISANLGNNAQYPDYPQEIMVGQARYLFDRIVPLRPQDLTQIAQAQSLLVYAHEQQEPFGTIYVSVPTRSGDELGRYLPEHGVETHTLRDESADAGMAGIEIEGAGSCISSRSMWSWFWHWRSA